MKTKVYALRDVVMNNFSLPFFAVHDDHAKRICSDLVNRGEGTVVYDHPEDHDLYLLGVYDDTNGLIDPLIHPELIVKLSTFRTTEA